MHRIHSRHGTTVSFDREGSGPPLVLVHGAFSDHRTNWEFVLPSFARQFTVYSVARRGRGETDATKGHTLEDESEDVAALIGAIGEPVFLLGHSYGAHVALGAASMVGGRVRKLVLYEPAWPNIVGEPALSSLTRHAQAGDWAAFSLWFFRNVVLVPEEELQVLQATELWEPIIADAEASFGDLLALNRYDFDADRFLGLEIPVLLQIGSESPRHLYATDALFKALPDVRIQSLEGQAHEGMTTAPEQYEHAVIGFLADGVRTAHIQASRASSAPAVFF